MASRRRQIMCKKTEKEKEILTIGAPKISALSKNDYNTFISCLEFQIREFYKEKEKKVENNLSTDKKG